MKKLILLSFIFCMFPLDAFAGKLVEGVLMVDGAPFYPLGSWNHSDTTPEDVARLGMNTNFQGAPEAEKDLETFRNDMRRCNELGIQVIPYLFYGGARFEPWTPEALDTIAKLKNEPNLLSWYVGDDISMAHLPGIRKTVTHLRKETPDIPIGADYIEGLSPEAQDTFRNFIDVRCQYYYPIPHDPFADYLTFFDDQRSAFGDPLWTWVQCFMWGFTGSFLDLGDIGPSPLPDPEQVRLMSYAAINRGVRGILFFSHHSLSRLPEIAGEVALTCREISLFNDHFAAGTPTLSLKTSHEYVNAAAYSYNHSVVVSMALLKPHYHQYVDEGIVENLTVDCPWTADTLPTALLVSTPDVIKCGVETTPEKDTIRITIPRLELAGFLLLSSDPAEQDALSAAVQEIPGKLKQLILPAAIAQTRKVNGVVWQLGIDNLNNPSTNVRRSTVAGEQCADALIEGRYTDAFIAWRTTMRSCRTVLREAMESAEQRRDSIPAKYRQYLASPYGLHNIRGLGEAPPLNDPWQFIRKWKITGPFPLDWSEENEPYTPAGFERTYPPETDSQPNARFDTLDGPDTWRNAESGVSGLLDPSEYFRTVENVVCYTRATIIAPSEIDAKLSIGSNDGARVWVNGELVYSKHLGRTGAPHDDEIKVRMKKGANPVLIKSENMGRSWKLYFSIYDPDRIFSLTTD